MQSVWLVWKQWGCKPEVLVSVFTTQHRAENYADTERAWYVQREADFAARGEYCDVVEFRVEEREVRA